MPIDRGVPNTFEMRGIFQGSLNNYLHTATPDKNGKFEFGTNFLYQFLEDRKNTRITLDSFARIVKSITPHKPFFELPQYAPWPHLSQEVLKILELVNNLECNTKNNLQGNEPKPVKEIMEKLEKEFSQYHDYLSPELQQNIKEYLTKENKRLAGENIALRLLLGLSENTTILPISAQPASQSSGSHRGG